MDGHVKTFRNIVVGVVAFAIYKMKIIHEMKAHNNSIRCDIKRGIENYE